jgi:outer membrane protein insertion porin family
VINRNNISFLIRLPRHFQRLSLMMFAGIFISGCTATKFLKEDESFYAGSNIKIAAKGKIGDQGELKEQLKTLITPEPNGVLLGMRPSVWFYYKAGTPKKKKGFRNFVRTKLGSPPVLLKDATPEQTAQALEGQLNNEGYFKSEVSFEIKTKRKKSTINYNVTLEQPYRIKTVNYIFLDTAHARLLTDIKKQSLIKENQRYSLDLLSAEQQRIQEVAQNKGFYFFDDRYLLFKADTTLGERMVELDLTVEPGMPERAFRVYTVNEVTVFPSYDLANDSLSRTGDSIRVGKYLYVDNQHNFRPHIITNVINITPDSIYRRIDHEYTLSHLMGLNTFKFVNIKYRSLHRDSSKLRASVFLTPTLKKSIRGQVQGVSKSNNFVGPGVEVSFTNRNLFRGAEMLQFKLNGSYEMQIRSQQTTPLNALELGGEASLSVPRFITPFKIRYRNAKYLPQTQFKFGYSYQHRLQYFTLNSSNIAAGYVWRETTLKTHELFPIDITFVRKSNTSAEFDEILSQNPSLENSFQNQFILGAHYSYIYNTQLSDNIEAKYVRKKIKQSNFYFNGTIDISGNIPRAIQSVRFDGAEGPYSFFGQPYSQYVRPTVDFRYFYNLNRSSKIATRINTGIGYAYGNSTVMPYIKQFAVGGSNSLRAFPARSVGPGTYNYRAVNDSTFFIDQRGDIRLEGSIEYRFDIYKAVKGGLFIDAGNIWLIKNDTLRPGGQFDVHKFYKELAVGTGFGLRFDFSFFVLRFDLAFPIRKTYVVGETTIGEGDDEQKIPLNEFRWAIKDIDFSSKSWRRNNLVLNIAIGYPF